MDQFASTQRNRLRFIVPVASPSRVAVCEAPLPLAVRPGAGEGGHSPAPVPGCLAGNISVLGALALFETPPVRIGEWDLPMRSDAGGSSWIWHAADRGVVAA